MRVDTHALLHFIQQIEFLCFLEYIILLIKIFTFHTRKNVLLSKNQDGSNKSTHLISVTFNKSQKTIIPFNIASVVEDKKPASLPPSSCSLHSAPTRFPIFQ